MFSFLDYMPFFMVITSLYNPSALHPNLPPVDLVENHLDVCPIKNSWKLYW